jgi:hypothetical protein
MKPSFEVAIEQLLSERLPLLPTASSNAQHRLMLTFSLLDQSGEAMKPFQLSLFTTTWVWWHPLASFNSETRSTTSHRHG